MSETAAAVTPMADHIKQFWQYLERERVRILVDLHRDGYCDSSSFNDEFAKALLAERTAAQKKIAELEAERDDVRIRAQNLFSQKVELELALTAERQRREKCEAAMQAAAYLIDRLQASLAGKPVRDLDEAFEAYSNRTNEAVLAISRYPTASDSEERGG